MSWFTNATRMWLLRSFKPFNFSNRYDQELDYESCDQLGLYVHIPFCRQICSFCPYCKVLYNEEVCNNYIDHLIAEIKLVTQQSKQRKEVTSLYFGGGSPALASNRIHEIIQALKEHFIIREGIGLELHPQDVNIATLSQLKAAGVSKISIGIQSFNDKFLSTLGRKAFQLEDMRKALAAVTFETVSMDFIFALPEQNKEDLISDIELAFSIGANHIAIYPFIDFSFTKSKLKALEKNKKRKLLDEITLYCAAKGYHRDSIWTFSNNNEAKYSSMTRDNFLGFGCSATTLLRTQFKVNTFSIEAYQKRIQDGKLPSSLTSYFSERGRMIYYLFWEAYSTKVSSRNFENYFGVPLKSMYGKELWLAKKLGFATESNGDYSMTLKGAFYYHHYESFYTLSYIDKMWGLMRNEAFPEKMEL